MINERPNYWGKPLGDWHITNLEPLNTELGRTLVAKSCSVPNCGNVATWDSFCDKHLVEIEESYNEWMKWKEASDHPTLDTYFIPYEELQ